MTYKILQEISDRGHETVAIFNDPKSTLKAIVAIHSTVLGPSLGGLRVYPYQNEMAAFSDVLRLSEAMSYKSAIAGMPLGGGKACIIADPKMGKGRRELFEAFAKSLNGLAGRYITAEDMGTTADDMRIIKNNSQYVVGFPESMGGSGDPSPWTALGVVESMKAACKRRYGSDDLSIRSVSIQGVGSVGGHMLSILSELGARVIVCDTSTSRLTSLQSKYPKISIVNPESIYESKCDIFAPCAIGQTVNSRTVAMIKADIICGAANNQLSGADVYEAIQERGIMYCPDFVVNAGGVISVGAELNSGGWNKDWVMKKVLEIGETSTRILEESASRGLFSEVVALDIAKEIIANAGLSKKN